MMHVDLLNQLKGGSDVIAWFDGQIPSFHDAEVIELVLKRENASCQLKVHGFRQTLDLDASGHFKSVKHAIITFQLQQIVELELADFNHQNVIDGLAITRLSNGNFLLELKPSYGLWGKIEARNLRLELEPGVPQGSIYSKQSSDPSRP